MIVRREIRLSGRDGRHSCLVSKVFLVNFFLTHKELFRDAIGGIALALRIRPRVHLILCLIETGDLFM